METSPCTITIRLTDEPSRSKQAGPCWIRIGDTYATRAAKTVEAEIGQTVTATGKVTLRRASRTSEDRDAWTLTATGDPSDVVTLRLGSPQAVEVEVTGVKA